MPPAEFEIALLQGLLASEREALAAGDSAFGRSWRSLRPVASTIARRHARRVSELENMLAARSRVPAPPSGAAARGAVHEGKRVAALRRTHETEYGHLLAQLMREHVSELTAYSARAARSDIRPEIREFLRRPLAEDEFDLRQLEQRAK